MLKYFLESRKSHRPFQGPAQRLADQANCSLILAQEVQWALYTPLPERFITIIDEPRYDAYRLETRQQFGEAFDFPRFTTFLDLSDYFACSLQELAKAFCLQRSLMQAHDRARAAGSEFYRKEINLALAQSIGFKYAFDPRNNLVASTPHPAP